MSGDGGALSAMTFGTTPMPTWSVDSWDFHDKVCNHACTFSLHATTQ